MKLTKKEICNPRENEVYKRALKFRKEIYTLVKGFPELGKFNMVDQLRRASTSLPTNISEGFRNHYYGKGRDCLNTSLGSIAECQGILNMARMEDYITQEQYHKFDDDVEVIFEMLLAMIQDIDRILEQHDQDEEE